MVKTNPEKISSIALPAAAFLAIISLWEIFLRFYAVPEYILPAPSRIAADLFSNIGMLAYNSGITLCEAFLGFLAANLFALVTAAVFVHSKTIKMAFYPFAIAIKITPIVAIAPLLILWFGNGFMSKAATAAIIAFFPILVNTVKGLESVGKDELDLFKSLSASKWQIFVNLRFPAALPYIFSALKVSTSLAIVGALVGEFVGSNKGIGFVILMSSHYLDTVRMFSAIISIVLVGIFLFGAISLIEKKILFWSGAKE